MLLNRVLKIAEKDRTVFLDELLQTEFLPNLLAFKQENPLSQVSIEFLGEVLVANPKKTAEIFEKTPKILENLIKIIEDPSEEVFYQDLTYKNPLSPLLIL